MNYQVFGMSNVSVSGIGTSRAARYTVANIPGSVGEAVNQGTWWIAVVADDGQALPGNW